MNEKEIIKKEKESFLYWLIGVGSFFIFIGITYFLYENWDLIPKFFKALLSILIPVTPLFFSNYFKDTKEFETFSKYLSGLSILLISASIGLISNIYQLQGDFVSFLITWVVFSTPIVIYFNYYSTSLIYIVLVYLLVQQQVFSLYVGFGNYSFSNYLSHFFDYGLRISSFFTSSLFIFLIYFFDKTNFIKKGIETSFKAILHFSIFLFIFSGFFAGVISSKVLFNSPAFSLLIQVIYSCLFIAGLIYLIYETFERKNEGLRVFLIIVFFIYAVFRVFGTIQSTSLAIIVSGILMMGMGFFLFKLNNKTK